MGNKAIQTSFMTDLDAQRKFIEKLRGSKFDFSLMVAEAFVRGIRDIGYKHTGTALDEFIDNSIQAGAQNIHVVFGFNGASTKPDKIAVIDDGHGMEPDMIRVSIIWGGTHRENDRKGFGRYGYGLPSAAVSQGRRFTVFSKIKDGQFYINGLDVDEIGQGAYTDEQGRVVVPSSAPANLPDWIDKYIETEFVEGFNHGTVIILETLDKLTWVTEASLERNLLEHFGVTYRNWLRQINICVNNKKVEPTDPLFTTEGFRFYDLTDVKAEPLEPIYIDVKDRDSGKIEGKIKVRFSYLSPLFTKANPKNLVASKENPRLNIMKDHNGIIVLRNGRQIEVVPPPRDWLTIQNNDRYWNVEVDFPAVLDEEFSVTTSKQTVRLSDRMWDLLKENGVLSAIKGMQGRWKKENDELKQKREDQPIRPAEKAMQEADRFKTTLPVTPTPERQAEIDKRFEQEAEKKAAATGKPIDEVKREMILEAQESPYRVMREHHPGAPFYRVEQIGGQKVIYLNTAHSFYSKIYWSPDSTPYLRSSLEVLLLVFGDAELEATDDRRMFYEMERSHWSQRLTAALSQLDKYMEANKQEKLPDEAEEPETGQLALPA